VVLEEGGAEEVSPPEESWSVKALFRAMSDDNDTDVHTSPNAKTPTHAMYPAQKKIMP
jgi:hypothetical protein